MDNTDKKKFKPSADKIQKALMPINLETLTYVSVALSIYYGIIAITFPWEPLISLGMVSLLSSGISLVIFYKLIRNEIPLNWIGSLTFFLAFLIIGNGYFTYFQNATVDVGYAFGFVYFGGFSGNVDDYLCRSSFEVIFFSFNAFGTDPVSFRFECEFDEADFAGRSGGFYY